MKQLSDKQRDKYEKIFMGFAVLILMAFAMFGDFEVIKEWKTTTKFIDKVTLMLWCVFSAFIYVGSISKILEYRVNDYLKQKYPEVWSGFGNYWKDSDFLKNLSSFEKRQEYLSLNDHELNKRVLLKGKFQLVINFLGAIFLGMVLYGFVNELKGPHWKTSISLGLIAFSASIIGVLVLRVFKKK